MPSKRMWQVDRSSAATTPRPQSRFTLCLTKRIVIILLVAWGLGLRLGRLQVADRPNDTSRGRHEEQFLQMNGRSLNWAGHRCVVRRVRGRKRQAVVLGTGLESGDTASVVA